MSSPESPLNGVHGSLSLACTSSDSHDGLVMMCAVGAGGHGSDHAKSHQCLRK